jgi:hypothetical protein
MICSKNITGLFRSRKTFKNAVEKHCVNGSQRKLFLRYAVGKFTQTFADFTL